MDVDKSELRRRLRTNLRELLVLLSDSARQFDYAMTVGDKIAIDEMFCMWFDDHYHGDNEKFKEMYDSEELTALKNFNDFFDSISDSVPESDIKELNADKNWIRLRDLAIETLEKIKE